MLVVGLFGLLGLAAGATVTLGQHASAQTVLPCRFGGPSCINIGFTEAWLEGNTVDLGYSHDFFCANPPSSGASSKCEAGAAAQSNPPSGPVVSPIWWIVPRGFAPPASTLHCPQPGQCIDAPANIDLSRIGASSSATTPPHSKILVEDESFQSTWWPVIIVFVRNQNAWNQLVSARSREALQACQSSNNCSPDFPTNIFEFFQVLGPGMSPQGPD